jgi:hypothetical protein
MENFEFTHGIMVIAGKPDEDGRFPIVHFCGYLNPITDKDIDLLKQELATDPEFGLVGVEGLVYSEAPAEIVKLYRESMNEIPETSTDET